MKRTEYRPGLRVFCGSAGLHGSADKVFGFTVGDLWQVANHYFCKVKVDNGATHDRCLTRLKIVEDRRHG